MGPWEHHGAEPFAGLGGAEKSPRSDPKLPSLQAMHEASVSH